MDLPANPSALIDLLRAWFFAKDRSIVMADNTFIEGDEISTPGNPVSGRRRLYAKDDCWYELNSNGTEKSLCSPEYVIIADQKAAGTQGGTFTSGAWRTRDLNTTILNTINSGYSLAVNQFTLPSGSYIIYAIAPAFIVNYHTLRCQNVTDASTVRVGATSRVTVASDNINLAVLIGAFTIASSKIFEIQHRCSLTRASNGFGVAINSVYTVPYETYTQVWILKYA